MGNKEQMPEKPWCAKVLTLFPELFPGPLGVSLPGTALAAGLWKLEALDIRAFAGDKHRTVDGAPFGGGPGMVLRPDVVVAAVDAACADGAALPVLCLSPRGRPLVQSRVQALAEGPGAVILCGRYEGIDARAIEARGIEEVCVGDFVVAGGDALAMAVIEAAVRLLPCVLGNAASTEEESFSEGLLEYPQYTRPAEWEGLGVPEPLLSGHHGHIAAWRQEMAERTTQERRPDLWLTYKARHRN